MSFKVHHKVKFNGRTYTYRWLTLPDGRSIRIAGEDLQDALQATPPGLRGEAAAIDQMIYYYMTCISSVTEGDVFEELGDYT